MTPTVLHFLGMSLVLGFGLFILLFLLLPLVLVALGIPAQRVFELFRSRW